MPRKLSKLLDFVNVFHESIRFTSEIENEDSLNFLALCISRMGSSLSFKVHRKSSATDILIPENSKHCFIYIKCQDTDI